MNGISLAPLLTKIKVDLASFKSDMQKATTAAVGATKEMSKKMANAAKIGEGFSKLGADMTKKVTLPFIAAGATATKFAMDVDTSFAKVSTILDKTKVSTEDLKKGVIAASNESGIAVTDFNEALYESLSAGIDSGNAIKFTSDMAKLAKGGFTETSKAVDVVTSVLNAYGMSADQATSISDKLITTQNIGKTTVDDLASSLGKIIPTANAFGVGVDDVSTAMAQLTKNGIQTAEATTYYNAMLNELGKSGTDASDAIKEKLGASFTDLMKQGVPLTNILKALKEKAEESGVSLSDMFGSSEAAKAALTIMKGDGAEYNEILGQMKNSAGATQKAFETMDATPANKLKKALNSLKNTAIELGAAAIPLIEKVAKLIENLTAKFSSLTPEQQNLIIKTGLVVAAIGPLLSIIGKAITLFTTLSPAVGAASAAISAAGGIMPAVGAAIASISAPVLIIIGVITALAICVATNFGGIRDTVVSVLSSVKDFIQATWSLIKLIWENDLYGIKTVVMDVFTIIANTINSVLKVIKDVFNIFSAAFRGDWSGCWNAVKQLVSDIWQGIVSFIGNMLNLIVDIILGIGTGLLNAAYNAFMFVKNGAVNAWNSLINWLKGAINDPIGTILSIGSAMWKAGADIFTSLWDGCKSIWNSISNWFSSKIDWVKDKLTFWKDSKSEIESTDGSHYNGLSYVPFDGYTARLHKGERVLTAEENKNYIQGNNTSNVNQTLNFYGKVESPYEVAKATKKSMRDLSFA